MRRLVVLLLLLAACGDGADPTTTTSSSLPDTTTTSSTPSTTAEGDVRTCPAAPYRLDFLPITVSEEVDPTGVEPDVWTSVGGSRTTFYGRNDGTIAIAVVRGTLPARDWPGDKGEVMVDGTRAAVGPHPDGTWVMGWYHEPAGRCDLYTMVFYPPWAPPEVEEVIENMVRIPG